LRPAATDPLDQARRALQAQAIRGRQPAGPHKQEATRLEQTASDQPGWSVNHDQNMVVPT
jgi:hypothetical protein